MPSALPIQIQRAQAKQRDEAINEQASQILLQNTGKDVRAEGKATNAYIRSKYGMDDKEPEARSKSLHDEIMSGNRENCLDNYLYFTQHYDFSEKPKIATYQDVEHKALDLFGKAHTYSYGTLPEFEEQELARKGEKELDRFHKMYPKEKTIDDTYAELKPVIDEFLTSSSFKQQAKSITIGMSDDAYQWKENRKNELTSEQNEHLNSALEKMKHTESGFLLHTKIFQDNKIQCCNIQ